MNKLARQRLRMFLEHPFCHWCKRKLIWPKKAGRWYANGATIDHLYFKGDPERNKRVYGERRRVLACGECNVNRHNPFNKMHRSLEEAWRASRQWPRMAYQSGALPGEVG